MLRRLAREGRISGRKRGHDWFLEKNNVLAYVKEMERLGTAKRNPQRTGEARGHVPRASFRCARPVVYLGGESPLRAVMTGTAS
jgi:hypothetical protein